MGFCVLGVLVGLVDAASAAAATFPGPGMITPNADSLPPISMHNELIPSVQCIRYLALNGSTELPLFEAQMKQLGLWDRVTVQIATPDPGGKTPGCFRSHVRAWKEALADGCTHAMVLEEDVFFENLTVAAAMDHANRFIAEGRPYDMMFLGWELSVLDGRSTKVVPIPGFRCVFKIHNWADLHAYIISEDAMRRYENLTFNETRYGDDTPIDSVLSVNYDRDRFFAPRPQCAFQRAHKLTKAPSDDPHAWYENSPIRAFMDQLLDQPLYVHTMVEDPVYFNSSIYTPWTSCI